MEEDLKYWVALNFVSGIGPRSFGALVQRFGSPRGVLEASVEDLCSLNRISLSQAQEIIQLSENLEKVEEEIERLQENGIKILTLEDSSYPNNLRSIDDAPPVIYLRGELKDSDNFAVAIVGTRSPTEKGLQVAQKLSRGLAERGVTIVSGLALGIDTAAHRGALKGGGKTIAVLGCGINLVHPRQNARLAQKIAIQGAVISEFAPNSPPQPKLLMARNRTQSGLSLGVIVVQARERGGALVAAHYAKKQGRFLFAVDWDELNEQSLGTKELLRKGAIPIIAENLEDQIDNILEIVRAAYKRCCRQALVGKPAADTLENLL